MTIFKRPSLKFGSQRKREMPEGLWTKCPDCSEMIHHLALEQNLRVCPACGYHFSFSARDRIANLVDEGSFVETNAFMQSTDVLKFKGVAAYEERLRSYQKKTGEKDAVVTGNGAIEGRPFGIAVMDFQFLGGSMASVVGEKITAIIEESTQAEQPVVIVSASGGARMYEGVFSLMQMAKTSGALARHAAAKLPFISVLTNPTMGGVTASFATLGDIILAEPKSMIGFAGPRVIREIAHQELPKGFQTAEFLLEHGLIDAIVPRAQMRQKLAMIFEHLL
ncbi:MAG: acetyl-CoA carboxylase carboxyltransferase subunit beta [Verrucomicrobia bacterium]|nr:acetyl-CoA carboxylase carboxyltransferase subunit beta [Verrucomicrobiota bacterium]